MAWRTLLALAYAASAEREGVETSLVQVGPPEKKFALQEAVSLHRKEVDHCSGKAFQVSSDQSCDLLQACSGLTRVCCQKEGETCSGVTSKLTTGDLCYTAYGEAPCNSLAFQQEKMGQTAAAIPEIPSALPSIPWDWWPKALPQTGASVHKRKVTCDGQPFTVVSGDTCYAYQTACPNQKFLCCEQAGQTCTAEKSSLFAQDTCWSSTGKPCDDGPDPGPTPSMNVGNWIKTWSTHQLTPDPWMVICFSGYAKLSDAMGECERTKSSMPAGPLWLSLGGGDCNSYSGDSVTWSQEVLEDLITSIPTVDLSSYAGIFFDLETNSGGCTLSIGSRNTCKATSGTSYGTSPSGQLFSQAFEAVKGIGLKVGVSWSYQMPYCMDNAAEIVQVSLASDAVSIVSPQMYNGGGTFTSQEVAPAAVNGNSHITYSDYVNVKGGIYPSYTLVNQQYDMTKNLQNMEQMQSAMLSWAKGQGIQSFMDSPGCLAYQNQ